MGEDGRRKMSRKDVDYVSSSCFLFLLLITIHRVLRSREGTHQFQTCKLFPRSETWIRQLGIARVLFDRIRLKRNGFCRPKIAIVSQYFARTELTFL